MTTETPYSRMRRAADWLEKNGIDWAIYSLNGDWISFGYIHADCERHKLITELCKGMTADVSIGASTTDYAIESTADRCGYRWSVWTKRQDFVTETVVIGGEA